MQNYLEALWIKTKEQLEKELNKKKWIVKNLEGLWLQDFDVYKENRSSLNEMENVYNSFADISKASEQDARSIISRANSLLWQFVDDTRKRDQEIQESITNVATNTVAAMAGPATRAGLSTAASAIPTQQVMSQAQQQRAQQASLTDQKIQEAAIQFLNMQAGASWANIANQINIRQQQEAARAVGGWGAGWSSPKKTWAPTETQTATEQWSFIDMSKVNPTALDVALPRVEKQLESVPQGQRKAFLENLIRENEKQEWTIEMARAYKLILDELNRTWQL